MHSDTLCPLPVQPVLSLTLVKLCAYMRRSSNYKRSLVWPSWASYPPSTVDRNFCLLCAYIRYSMFYFLYLDVYFLFFDFLYLDVYFIFFELNRRKENKRPNKENRTWNSEYMHTGDRSFGLHLQHLVRGNDIFTTWQYIL